MAKSPYLFGVRHGKLPRGWVAKIRKIADAEDCNFYVAQGQSWFATRSNQLGDPFDRDTARRVVAAIEADGIDYYGELAERRREAEKQAEWDRALDEWEARQDGRG